ncbi:hypothetical protein [Microbacterium sp. BK668]|uniref:hypothetical protein n=1 Tax=Microbacterium sp. BK668 TaxID=2512118 RepID=UPI001FB6A618|nr:hypothetical protein [Microbacterium sp. BK668]
MSDYQLVQIGSLDEWRDHYGGFRPTTSRDGRRVVDHEIAMQYIGMTANAFAPGEERATGTRTRRSRSSTSSCRVAARWASTATSSTSARAPSSA